MIFKKLVLKNFMSYSNAEIDFSGIHTACLIGPNGSGKSTLLDAITWALWEEGRARTDELIKLGQDEMTCELEFFMEEELYRVYRSRLKAFRNTQGKSNLEFQIFSPKEKNWISLSMTSVRQTQDLIIKTIKMDYQTFVNSVYLRQGKADEFTVKRPNERKQILSDILNLEVYDKLSESAKDKVKKIEQAVSFDQIQIKDLTDKVLKEEEISASLKFAIATLNEKEKELARTREILSRKEKELSEKIEKEKQIHTLERTKLSQESLIKTLENQLVSMRLKEAKHKELISNKLKVQADYKEYLNIKDEIERTERLREKYNGLSHEKNVLELELKEKINQIEQQLAIYKSKLSDRSAAKSELLNCLKNEDKFHVELKPKILFSIKEFYELQEKTKNIENGGNEIKTRLASFELERKNIVVKKQEINKKITSLVNHKHSDLCPLCKSPITDKEAVISSYKQELGRLSKEEEILISKVKDNEKEIKDKRDEYAFTKSKMAEIKANLNFVVKELSGVRQEKVELKQTDKLDDVRVISYLESCIEVSNAFFNSTKEQIVLLDKEISTFKGEHDSLKSLLISGEIVREVSSKLTQIIKEITSLSYNENEYVKLKKLLAEKENVLVLYSNLGVAETELEAVVEDIQALEQKLILSRKDLEELGLLISQNKLETENIFSVENELNAIKEKEKQEYNQAQEVKKQVILYEKIHAEIESSKLLLKEKEARMKVLFDDKKHYEALERAFSKNGIQVAVIEAVVPEIEKEANRILSRLTDNQMHIAVKTQREKRSASGLVETLDVVISDALGTRNYELYSGGEAFKINFTLRLALSRLLANRSNARLQTLIIDEGFGSQDLSGRERLLEVIKLIQNEFELILLVTHLDELKESFPVQIHVSKSDEEGSVVKLIA